MFIIILYISLMMTIYVSVYLYVKHHRSIVDRIG